jgi:hypothetical protein
MFNIFKKKNKSNNDLLDIWLNFARENGFSEGQIIGLAYFNSAIPTVLANVNQDQTIVDPLQKVISEIGIASSEGANVLYLFKELFYAASTNDNELNPLTLDGIPDGFFSQDDNPYFKYSHSEFGFFKKSRVSVMLIQRMGKILEDYKISVPEAFQLGHSHMNFLLNTTSRLNAANAVIMSNILPDYLAGIIDMIPNPNSLNSQSDLWLFSKIFHQTISNELSNDALFCEWLWYFHNAIFYENKPGSTKVKSEWSLDDPKIEINMLEAIMDVLPPFYRWNNKIGSQQINSGKSFSKWEEFFPILNEHLKTNYGVQSPADTFVNKGETCNYLAYKFIASSQIILANSKVEK